MKRLLSFKYAFQGLKEVFNTQANARVHAFAATLVLGLSWWLSLSKTEWALIILAIFWVLAAEAFNTAIEYLTDLCSPDYHVLAGKTKDVAAAAVLLSATGAATIGLLIFVPKLWERFSFFF